MRHNFVRNRAERVAGARRARRGATTDSGSTPRRDENAGCSAAGCHDAAHDASRDGHRRRQPTEPHRHRPTRPPRRRRPGRRGGKIVDAVLPSAGQARPQRLRDHEGPGRGVHRLQARLRRGVYLAGPESVAQQHGGAEHRQRREREQARRTSASASTTRPRT